MVTILIRDNETNKVLSKCELSKEDFESWLHVALKANHRLTNIGNSIIFIEFTYTHVTCITE